MVAQNHKTIHQNDESNFLWENLSKLASTSKKQQNSTVGLKPFAYFFFFQIFTSEQVVSKISLLLLNTIHFH